LVDASNNVIKSFDYPKNNVKKGDTLGSQFNGTWTLDQTDQSNIQDKINSVLNGTNYSITTLTPAQVSQLAQAKFGASVNLTANSTTTNVDVTRAITLNYVDASTGARVKTTYWAPTGVVNGQAVDMTNGQAWQFLQVSPDGYSVNVPNANSALFKSLQTAKYGESFNIPVSRAATLTSTQIGQIFDRVQFGTDTGTNNVIFDAANTNPSLLSAFAGQNGVAARNGRNERVILNSSFYTNARTAFIAQLQTKVANGSSLSAADFKSALKAGNLDSFYLAEVGSNDTQGNIDSARNGYKATLDTVNHNAGTNTSDSTITLAINANGNQDAANVIYLHYTVVAAQYNGAANSTPTHGDLGQSNWTTQF
jgi:hypothetical protein